MSTTTMPKELFEQYASEYQQKITRANQDLMQLRNQLQSRQRERKLSELTNKELGALDSSTTCYRTVGKMFLKEDLKTLTNEMDAKISTCSKEINAIEKAALKVDQESKDAERNLDSLVERVTGGIKKTK